MPDVSPSVATPELVQPPSAPTPSAPPAATAVGSLSSVSVADADTAQLPQTHEMPSSSSPAFMQRAAMLWDAIVSDEPERAKAFFFPLGAYDRVKDVADPAADWKRRLLAAYFRDIHALHAQLGDAQGAARFVSLDVPSGRARWIDPGEEWNKIGYFRVFGSRLRYEANGESRGLEVKSLISWRGEWYVVHLSAIR
jgi:hypothetical protein